MEDQTAQNPIQEPVPNPVPVSSPSTSRNWITILFSVLVLLLLISTGYLYYQNQQLKNLLATYQSRPSPAPSATTDPMLDWKTYTNTQHSYSFQYPDTIFSIQENGSKIRLIKATSYSFEVEVIQSADTIDGWLKKEKANGQFPDSDWKSIQTTFQNYPALLLQSLPNTIEFATDIYVVKNNNKIYKIAFSKEESDKTIADQILSTFKLLRQTSEYNTQTYRRIDNFSFQYPADWLEKPNYSLQSSDGKMTIFIEGSTLGIECYTQNRKEVYNAGSTNLELTYYQGIRSINCDNNGKSLILIPFKVNGTQYNLTFSYQTIDEINAVKIIKSILSTFKFTQ